MTTTTSPDGRAGPDRARRALALRLEASAAEQGLALVQAYRRASPLSPATGVRHGIGAFCALGPGRYVNRAIGFGLAEPDQVDLDQLADFFEPTAPPALELSNLAPATLRQALDERGYRPDAVRSVLVHELADRVSQPDGAEAMVQVTEVDDQSVGRWREVMATGFGAVEEAARAVCDEHSSALQVMPESLHLLGWLAGRPAACGSLQVVSGVGWLGGAATAPWARNRGCQSALIERRLTLAAELGCDVVAVTATPGSVSERNLGRHGFRLLYTQQFFVG
ncbi:hypothetical protein GCM10009841_12210 [Microlunatus panaciterrae]|uniref:N-acetyltransferase domain-containing protein n=1 Tax=Microlunatus panaciterrae TaxID=400768 RepID=A0ABS2RMQ5_9ACTN|nr:hypothetical protein [Microlunatus panaciterrae]MBM7799777.1 hypothetical protein [Microlunatus panaciterrae]